MEIRINRELQIVEAWLTHEDQNDPGRMAQLRTQLSVWRSQHLTPVLYRSGREALYENTLALLQSNRRRSAAQDHVAANRRDPAAPVWFVRRRCARGCVIGRGKHKTVTKHCRLQISIFKIK